MSKNLNQTKSDSVQFRKKRIEHWQVVSMALAGYDAIAIILAFFLALWFRFDCRYSLIPKEYLGSYVKFIGIYVIFSLLVFWRMHLYNSIWRFASYNELIRMVFATGISFIFHCTGMSIFFGRMPISYYFFGILVQFGLTLAVRFAYRFVLLERDKRRTTEERAKAKKVLLIGGGKAGRIILRDIKTAKELKDIVCCIIDDNPNKWGRYIEGVQIVGGRDDIMSCVERYKIDKIVLAIPSATAQEKRDILNICKETGCELKNLPGVYQFLTGEIKVSALRDVAVEELLGRDPIKVNMEEIHEFINGKKVMVTGGGGSIGSGLCRQIASYNPKQLIVFDIYENNAYDIQQELKKKYPKLDLVVLVGSIRDSRRINAVFETYKPDVVYHAAAHKHVPLMEDSPCESIKNNAIGTYKTAYAAMMNGCQRFVLISTDKAVNPTNIMGASKRLCEMIIQSFDRMIKEGTPEKLPILYAHADDEDGSMIKQGIPKNLKTEFVAVRFGNVLGSNGSVIPLFKKQIEAGGPVTVTHPDIIRYFMTIPEAVSLVLQAGTYAHGGEIFVLDMGSPVKIDTLARNLIKLSGMKPDIDIKVEYTGLRQGEKLYEEKLMAEEGLKKTRNELIHIGCPIPFEVETFLKELQTLMDMAYTNAEDIREKVAEVVTTYHPAGEHGSEKKGEVYERLLGEESEAQQKLA
ncbi:polysaccharide biosynthesis protein [Mediterraneibacter gnavus]|uniref:Polysaccharide biosynthesis protein n=1 Tax=Mediterraneibacter gnavus (strain ATCC 29149 / DSM 114966 / JCM 6515 / VPI C7-9) TaxID=411470 RepID=A7B2R5_MEDG7|nr:nucleoside-diphosphate sugar epimerase/dehydratase [Mediterraneibacter gnavus]EDN77864.1 polysaccharide biosynthesis protein [Mediterraneibacter gnavus ATCC 29149]